MAKTRYEGEVLSHRVLWFTACVMRDRAEADSRGAIYFDMTAMLLARLTVEAYCNFLLDVLHPDVFAAERKTFGGDIGAKVSWLSEKVGYKLERGKRPYSTIRALGKFRDSIVHAKPERYSGELTHPIDVDPRFMQPGNLHRDVSPPKRVRAMDDVESLCQALHERAIAVAEAAQRRRLELFALKGGTQWETTSTGLLDV